MDLSETILIIDEAHNIINLKKIIQMIESFPRVLLVTATPPSIMDELIVGDIIYQYSMQKAIENHYICDYKIYLPVFDETIDSELYIKIPEEIDIEDENETLYKKGIFLIEGLIQTSSRKCIVYLSDLDYCSIFEKILQNLIEKYYYFPYWINRIDCNTSSGDRDKLLELFQENESKHSIKILLSIRILDEGIDIPKCDSIFITSVGDYINDIRMIQRLCRATRIDKENINKKANCFIWTDNKNKINRSLKILKENDINFIGKIKYNKNLFFKNNKFENNNNFKENNELKNNKFKENKEKIFLSNINKINKNEYNNFFICSRCKKSFVSKESLISHLNKKYPCKDINGYNCPYCNKNFDRNYNYIRHIKDVCLKKNLLVMKNRTYNR